SHSVVAYGQKLPTVFSGRGVPSVPWPPTSRAPMSPSPFGPWHRAHFAAKTSRPAATLPDPAGKPVPSGAIADPSSRTSSGVGGCPTPNVGDCAASVTDATTTSALTFHIGHRPVRPHLPEFDPIEVIRGVRASNRDEILARGLHVGGLVDRARGKHGFATVEPPGQADTG